MIATLQNIWAHVLASIQHVGSITFIILVVIDIVLYRIHPVLGVIGILFTFALLFGLI